MHKLFFELAYFLYLDKLPSVEYNENDIKYDLLWILILTIRHPESKTKFDGKFFGDYLPVCGVHFQNPAFPRHGRHVGVLPCLSIRQEQRKDDFGSSFVAGRYPED